MTGPAGQVAVAGVAAGVVAGVAAGVAARVVGGVVARSHSSAEMTGVCDKTRMISTFSGHFDGAWVHRAHLG